MGLLNELGGLLQRYSSPGQSSANVEDDFHQVSQAAPQSTIANGLSAAFRSQQTPPFGQMLGGLFGNSAPDQRAGLLNSLLSGVGPGALGSILGSAGLGHLAGPLGNGQITPQQAQQVTPNQVQQMAEAAQQNDPSIVDRASSFYAQHPTLVKNIGAGALTLLLAHIASQQRG